MAYTTANGTSTDSADVFAGETGLPEERLDPLLRQAERLVATYSPAAPDPITEEYMRAASDSELQVFDFLVNTDGGLTSSTGVAGVSVSYRDLKAVETIVRAAMVGFEEISTGGSSGDNVAYIERFSF